jgi:hypothetical protein
VSESRQESNHASDFTRAIHAVLLELASILDGYHKSLVVSGGLAMHLLFSEQADAPVVDDKREKDRAFFARVTKDVDFVLNLVQLAQDFDDQQDTIGELLKQNLYQEEVPRQFWVRSVCLSGFELSITIPVEFLAPTPFHTGKGDLLLTQVAEQQEIHPAALDGVSLALLQPRQVLLSGEMPNGTWVTDVPIQVVDPAMLILIKAIAFADRLKKQKHDPTDDKHLDHAAKHAYDISQLLLRYPSGVSGLVERLILPYITAAGPEQPTIDQALQSLRAHFTERAAPGIRLMIREGEHRYEKETAELAQQGTIARVQRLLHRLDERMQSVY